MRILVVDDYPGAAQASCMLLEAMGHEVQSALDGTTALTLAVTFAPEVVILDIGLPDASGYDIARQLRSLPRRPFIVAMTGWGTVRDRVQSLAAGIDEHVVKPASMEKLTAIIEAAKRKLNGDDESDRA